MSTYAQEHSLKSRSKDEVVRRQIITFTCGCGYTTDDANAMDSHRHWELAERYAEALLDVFALLPPDRVHLVRPRSTEMIGKAQCNLNPQVQSKEDDNA